MQEKRGREREREREVVKSDIHSVPAEQEYFLTNAGRFLLLLPAKAPSRSGGGAGYGLLSRVALDRSFGCGYGVEGEEKVEEKMFVSSMLWSLLLS